MTDSEEEDQIEEEIVKGEGDMTTATGVNSGEGFSGKGDLASVGVCSAEQQQPLSEVSVATQPLTLPVAEPLGTGQAPNLRDVPLHVVEPSMSAAQITTATTVDTSSKDPVSSASQCSGSDIGSSGRPESEIQALGALRTDTS